MNNFSSKNEKKNLVNFSIENEEEKNFMADLSSENGFNENFLDNFMRGNETFRCN